MRLLAEESSENMWRVRNILALYEKATQEDIGTNLERDELLRAAVVFLHSGIEEIVRNLFVDRLPYGDVAVLNELTYSGYSSTDRSKGVFLGDLLHNHSGKLVENVIFDAINTHIDRLNINGTKQLVENLQKVQINIDEVRPYLGQLNAMMRRRHQIVHQMDREDAQDPDSRPISQITFDELKTWFNACLAFHNEVIRQAVPET